MSKYFILSIKHTKPSENSFTWWGPNRRGYYWDLNAAGVYSREEAESICDGSDHVAVPCEKARKAAHSHVPFSRKFLDDLGAIEAWNKREKRGW